MRKTSCILALATAWLIATPGESPRAQTPPPSLAPPVPATAPKATRLPKVGILPTAPNELITMEVGAKVFVNDNNSKIESLAPELVGLNAVRIARKDSKVELDTRGPVQLLIGIFHGEGSEWAPAPAKGLAIQNAAKITGLPPLDVYLLDFDKGKRVLPLHGTYVILGVIPPGVAIPLHDAQGGAAK